MVGRGADDIIMFPARPYPRVKMVRGEDEYVFSTRCDTAERGGDRNVFHTRVCIVGGGVHGLTSVVEVVVHGGKGVRWW